MAWLANTYGYASDMEGFSIADSDEVWYMELIGKGSFEKGVVWVALRVPDGYVSAHANQARITTFLPCDDPSACMAAPDAASRNRADGRGEDFARILAQNSSPRTNSKQGKKMSGPEEL